MSYTCAISGETAGVDMVVTPSGYICQKSLLLQKLTENSGRDPFVSDRPLLEDDLIELLPSSSTAAPRLLDTGTVSNTLKVLKTTHDAVVLELFDTRQQLHSTKQELTTALYQNDASMRVIARLAMERDSAKSLWKEQSNSASPEPAAKKLKSSAVVIPSDIIDTMKSKSEELRTGRKALLKERAKSNAVSKADRSVFVQQQTSVESAMGLDGAKDIYFSSSIVVDSNAVHYCAVGTGSKKLFACIGNEWTDVTELSSTSPTAIDHCSSGSAATIVVGHVNGSVDIVEKGADSNTTITTIMLAKDTAIVNVHIHPNQKHVLVTTCTGAYITVAATATNNSPIQFLSGAVYTCSAMHPDGILYVLGSPDGVVQIYDFNSQQVFGTLSVPDGATAEVTDICFSENGYHVGVAYGGTTIRIWDLRKQTVLATYTATTLHSMAFDVAGKYFVYHDEDSVRLVPVKEWTTVHEIKVDGASNNSALTFGNQTVSLVTASEKKQPTILAFQAK